MYIGIINLFCFLNHRCLQIQNRREYASTPISVISKYNFQVVEGSEKQRLDQFITSVMPNLSRSLIGNLCDQGLVVVNDKSRAKHYRVSPKDNIVVTMENLEASESIAAENIHLDILYEDEHILAINKPAGMVVHPAPGSPNGTFVNALMYYLGDNAKLLLETEKNVNDVLDDDLESMEIDSGNGEVPAVMRPGIVHRLDKGTTGVLLAAKHPEAVSKLSALFANRKISKTYFTICVGNPGQATIDEAIGRCKKNRQLMAVYNGPPGKPAVTHLRTLAFDGKLAAVLVRIETGRTHQIRVHLQHRRVPVLGDTSYGADEWNKRIGRTDGINRPLLHAYESSFIHPFTGENIVIRAPIPNDIAKLLPKLTPYGALPLLDPSTNLLQGSTEVTGKLPGQANKGLISLEALRIEDDDFTTYDLPEDPAFFGL